MFAFLKRLKDKFRKKEKYPVHKAEIIDFHFFPTVLSEEEVKDIYEDIKVESEPQPVIEPDPPLRIGQIKFCSTHGKELLENRACPACVEVAKTTETKDPLNNDMDQDGRHGDHFDKRVNQNKLVKHSCKEYPNLSKRGYFCHNCQIVLWHRLIWCPRCGSKFEYLKISNEDMCRLYPNYIVGY